MINIVLFRVWLDSLSAFNSSTLYMWICSPPPRSFTPSAFYVLCQSFHTFTKHFQHFILTKEAVGSKDHKAHLENLSEATQDMKYI